MKQKNVTLVCIWGLILMYANSLLKNNYVFFTKWYFTILMAGIVFFPITSLVFKKFKDRGWNFSKILGISITGLVLWFSSYMHLLKYTSLSAYIVMALFVGVDVFLLKKVIKIDKSEMGEFISRILKSEIIFICCFLFWTHFKTYSASISFSTEKYMNYGFLNQLYHAEYMPAEDMWLSGNIINYYYFGHYLASYIAKLSFSKVPETFNMFCVFVATMTLVGPFHICFELARKMMESSQKKWAKVVPAVAGVMGAIAICFGGSLYYPIYHHWVDRDRLGLGEYYYWEDSRYIGYRPETDDQTINEIIPYSNVLGDMHAQHLDTLMVFTTIAILLDLMLEEQDEKFINRLISVKVVILGCLLGMEKMANYWDFPIYLMVIFLCFLFNNITKYRFKKETFVNTGISIVEVLLVSMIVTAPFSRDLYLSASEVLPTHVHSPFYKMCVYWAFPTVCVLTLIVLLICGGVQSFKNQSKVKKKKEEGTEKKNWFERLQDYLGEISPSDLFVFVIGCCAIGLVIIPEFVYVKDIYSDSYKRANTVYKLCYQGDILFDLSVSYMVIKLLFQKSNKFVHALGVVFCILHLSTFGYGMYAVGYETDHYNPDKITSLDYTEKFIEESNPRDYKALQWIKENIDQHDVILEKSSGSFNFYCYVSVLTGRPTVLGWHGHEWIWRANKDYSCPQEVSDRWGACWDMYRNGAFTLEEMQGLVDKYHIAYIYISDPKPEDEDAKILKREQIIELGEVVYSDLDDPENEIYIVKTNYQK